jgi:hypothetical protein
MLREQRSTATAKDGELCRPLLDLQEINVTGQPSRSRLNVPSDVTLRG